MYFANYFRINNKFERRYGNSDIDSDANIFPLNTLCKSRQKKDGNTYYNINIT